MGFGRLQGGAVLKIDDIVEHELGAYISNMQLTHHLPELLHCPRPSHGTIADKPSRFIMPLVKEVIDGILQHPWDAVIVFRGDKNIGIKGSDFG